MPRGRTKKRTQKGRDRIFSSIEEMRRNIRNNFQPDDAVAAQNTDTAEVSEVPQLIENVPNDEDSDTGTDTDEEQGTQKDIKRKGVDGLIKVRNPNRLTGNDVDLTFHPEKFGRRKKPEKKADAERMREDLERLAIVRQQREEAAAKRKEAAAKREAEKSKKNIFKN